MDFREPAGHGPLHSAPMHSEPAPAPVVHHKRGGRGWLTFLLIIILVAAGAAAYWWRDKDAKEEANKQTSQITDLQSQVSDLQKDLKSAQEDAKKATSSQAGPSEDTLKKVQDAVKSGKYADMQSLLGNKVNVILAASEGLGSRTPAQVVTDLKYLDGGTDPWDFALPAETISSYQDGDYAQYFPVGALVGKSANNYVVSLVFNNSGKVTGIFMANKADIL